MNTLYREFRFVLDLGIGILIVIDVFVCILVGFSHLGQCWLVRVIDIIVG